jgi:hypothetical protein
LWLAKHNEIDEKEKNLVWDYDDPHYSHGNLSSFSDKCWNGGLIGKQVGNTSLPISLVQSMIHVYVT